VADIGEAGLPRDLLGPALDGATLDLDAAATGTAGQVVMVGVGLAAPVQDLARGVPDRVDPAALAQHLKVPVHGREADLLAAISQLRVDLLGTAEPRQTVKHRSDRLGLPRPADPGAVRRRAGSALGRTHVSHGSSQDAKLSTFESRRGLLRMEGLSQF
jgi:hypothetical protein